MNGNMPNKFCLILITAILLHTQVSVSYMDMENAHIRSPIVRLNETLHAGYKIIDLNELFNDSTTSMPPRASIRFINNTALLDYIKYNEYKNGIFLKKELDFKELCNKPNASQQAYVEIDYEELLNSEYTCRMSIQFIAMNVYKFVEIPIEIHLLAKPQVARLHFKFKRFNISIAETTRPGHRYLIDGAELIVKNPDYAKLTYTLLDYDVSNHTNETSTDACDLFDLNVLLNGKRLALQLKSKPNYTLQNECVLKLLAKYELDKNTTLSAHQIITISVINSTTNTAKSRMANKNAAIEPLQCEFPSYYVEIPYNTEPDWELIRIRLKNQVSNATVVYSMITKTMRNMNSNLPFYIDDASGTIRLNDNVAFNAKRPSYKLEIKATYDNKFFESVDHLDRYIVPAFCHVTINITYNLSNTVSPMGVSNYTYRIVDQTNSIYSLLIDVDPLGSNTLLARIEVMDFDIEKCNLTLSNARNFLTIQEKQTTTRTFYNLVARQDISLSVMAEQDDLNFFVLITNRNQYNKIDFELVLKQQDPIRFEKSEYILDVTRKMQPYVAIHNLNMTSAVYNASNHFRVVFKNERFNFSFDSNLAGRNLSVSNYFYLNSTTGVLYNLRKFDKYFDPNFFEFEIHVEAGDNHSALANVCVYVYDTENRTDLPAISNFVPIVSIVDGFNSFGCVYQYNVSDMELRFKMVRVTRDNKTSCEFVVDPTGCLMVDMKCLGWADVHKKTLKSGFYFFEFKVCSYDNDMACSGIFNQTIQVSKDLFFSTANTYNQFYNFSNANDWIFYYHKKLAKSSVKEPLIDSTVMILLFFMFVFFILLVIVFVVAKFSGNRNTADQQQITLSSRICLAFDWLCRPFKKCAKNESSTSDTFNETSTNYVKKNSLSGTLDMQVLDESLSSSQNRLNRIGTYESQLQRENSIFSANDLVQIRLFSDFNIVNKDLCEQISTKRVEGIYSVQKDLFQNRTFTNHGYLNSPQLDQSALTTRCDPANHVGNNPVAKKKVTLKQLKRDSAFCNKTNSFDSIDIFDTDPMHTKKSNIGNIHLDQSSRSSLMLRRNALTTSDTNINTIFSSIV